MAVLSRTADAAGKHDSTRLGGSFEADEMDLSHMWKDMVTKDSLAPMSRRGKHDCIGE